MTNYKNCFIAKFEGETYIMPQEEREEFDITAYYDRQNKFSKYILPDDVIMEAVLVDEYDFQCLIDGEFD